jgi:hypothetical protein
LGLFNTGAAWDPRFGHTSLVHGRKMYIYGGCKSFSTVLKTLACSNDIVIFDLIDKTIQEVKSVYSGPAGRKYHASVILGNNLYVMGGINSKNKVLNDIWSFNTDLKKWYKCRVDFKDCPELYESGIAQHEACVVKQNFTTKRDKEDPNLGYTEGIYIFGGRNDYAEANNNLCILRTGEIPMRMIRCQTKGTPPAPRFGHTMSYLVAKNNLVVFGGCGPSYVPCYGDLFTISAENLCWSLVTTTGPLPEPRTNHSMVNDRDALIIFGGINEAGFLPSDIHVIVLVDRGNRKKYDGMGS